MALLNQTQQDYYDGNDFGSYQFISLNDIVNNFIIVYVGENKIISKVKRTDVAFHAQRAIQELSFDVFKSIKSQEITLPPSNTMILPQDYVNYTKICWVDGNGIERPLYPTRHTSNPTPILQNTDGKYHIEAKGNLTNGSDQMVLDGQYNNILVGMVISGSWGDVEGNIVEAIAVSGGITTITMNNDSDATISTTPPGQVFKFTNPDGSLILENNSQVLATGLLVVTGTNLMSLVSATDIVNIEEGMLVSSDHFPVGTVVTSINVEGGFVYTDQDAGSGGSSLDIVFTSPINDSTTWNSYSSDTSNSTGDANGYNHDTDLYDLNIGQRYGVDPSIAQGNGTYYIDNLKGKIHFSSNVGGKNIVLHYISDGLGTDEEMVVHKFAEEAMYKSIVYAIVSTTISGQPLVPRFKKEKYAAIRQAKLRLSNLKIEELTQIMRGKSKWIKS